MAPRILLVTAPLLLAACAAALPTASHPGGLDFSTSGEDQGFTTLGGFARVDGELRIVTARASVDLPGLRHVEGNFELRADTAVSIDLSRLRRIGGSLRIHAPQATNIRLNALLQVDGELNISGKGPADLPSLEQVGQDMLVRADTGRLKVPRLVQVGGCLRLHRTGLVGASFSALERVGGGTPDAPRCLEVAFNPDLSRLHLPAVVETAGLSIHNNGWLAGVDLRQLKTVSGPLRVTANPRLIVLNIQSLVQLGPVPDAGGHVFSGLGIQHLGLESLRRSSGAVEVLDNPQLRTVTLGALELQALHFADLPQLRHVRADPLEQIGELAVSGCPRLQALDLSSLKVVRGNLLLHKPLPALTALRLGALEQVDGLLLLSGSGVRRLQLERLRRTGGLTLSDNADLGQVSFGADLRVVDNVVVRHNSLPICVTASLTEHFRSQNEAGSLPRTLLLMGDHDDCLRTAVDRQVMNSRFNGPVERCISPAASPGPVPGGVHLSFAVLPTGVVKAVNLSKPQALAEESVARCLRSVFVGKRLIDANARLWSPGLAVVRRTEVTLTHIFALNVRKPWHIGADAGGATLSAILGAAPWVHDAPVNRIVFTDDATLLSGDERGTVRLWSLARGLLHEFGLFNRPITDLAADATGSRVAVAAGQDLALITLLDRRVEYLQRPKILGHRNAARLAFAGQNSLWLANEAGEVELFDMAPRTAGSSPVGPSKTAGPHDPPADAQRVVALVAVGPDRAMAWRADGGTVLYDNNRANGQLHEDKKADRARLQEVTSAAYLGDGGPGGASSADAERWVVAGYGDTASAVHVVGDNATPLPLRPGVSAVVAVPRSIQVVFATGDELHFLGSREWRATRPPLRLAHTVRALAASPAGEQIAIGDEQGGIDVFSLASGDFHRQRHGHRSAVHDLTAATDVLLSVDETGRALRWQIGAAGKIAPPKPAAAGTTRRKPPLSATNERFFAWAHTHAGQCTVSVRSRIEAHWRASLDGRCTALLWLPGDVLAVGLEAGTVHFFDDSGAGSAPLQGSGPVVHLAEDRGRLAISRRTQVEIWALAGLSLMATIAKGADYVAFAAGASASGHNMILVRGRRLELWNSTRSSHDAILGFHQRDITSFSARGGHLLSASLDGTVQLFLASPAESGPAFTRHSLDILPGQRYPTAVAWLRPGRLFAVGTDSGEILIWRL